MFSNLAPWRRSLGGKAKCACSSYCRHQSVNRLGTQWFALSILRLLTLYALRSVPCTPAQQTFPTFQPVCIQMFSILQRDQLEQHQKRVLEFSTARQELLQNPPKKADKSRAWHDYNEKKRYLEFEVSSAKVSPVDNTIVSLVNWLAVVFILRFWLIPRDQGVMRGSKNLV